MGCSRSGDARLPERGSLARSRPARSRARWLWAGRVVRVLSPPAWALGGFASAEAACRLDGCWRWPSVVVGLGEPPCDGLFAAPPLLVVELGGCPDAMRWVTEGAAAVWVVGHRSVGVWTAGGERTVVPPERAAVPGAPQIALPVGFLLGCAGDELGGLPGARPATRARA